MEPYRLKSRDVLIQRTGLEPELLAATLLVGGVPTPKVQALFPEINLRLATQRLYPAYVDALGHRLSRSPRKVPEEKLQAFLADQLSWCYANDIDPNIITGKVLKAALVKAGFKEPLTALFLARRWNEFLKGRAKNGKETG